MSLDKKALVTNDDFRTHTHTHTLPLRNVFLVLFNTHALSSARYVTVCMMTSVPRCLLLCPRACAGRPTEPYVDDDPKGGSAGAGGSAGGGNGGASKGVEGEDSLPSNSEGSRTPDSVAPPLVPQPDGGAADVAASGADGSVRGGSAPVHQSLVITLSAEQVARMHRAAMANGNMASRPVAAGAPPAEIQEGSGGDSVTGENASAGNRAAPAGARGAHGAGADVGAGAPDPGGRARQQPEPGAAGPAAAAHATAAGAGAGVGVGAGADGAGRGGGRASPTGPATPAGANTAVTAVGGPGGGPAAAVQAAPAPSAPPQPAPPARDVPAELLEMSKAVRCSVQDVAIQMEAVIGAGSFGVVYKGESESASGGGFSGCVLVRWCQQRLETEGVRPWQRLLKRLLTRNAS